ncbi:hypothetical protein BEL04_23265 [Mucilaginibacter sp. PPCGB 2223]|uniref:ArnT family glycosyltransferase n=1 Tax=Mucilaginibacter sp. PPCGB 2223 TaxID=1886027 RepID=UPI00082507EF|nr:glycosyltransferase family 39 protein [Mucilaginibacter sp. PPCGB 2223]OCX50232.1 hypothetical protein BEL04_23265 [Mucilaginibacter sp. PPCGB 2223]
MSTGPISNTTSRLSRIKPLHIIVVLVVLQLLLSLLTNGFTLSSDEAMWHYIGRNWFRHGLVPYRGGVDIKSPVLFAVFGVSDWLFGINYWFPRVLGVICQSIGIFYIYKIAVKLAGDRAGVLAISFYGLAVLWHCVDGRYTSYDETYDVLFMILSAYFYIDKTNKSFLISGVLAAIAVGFRLSAGFGTAALLINLLYHNRRQALFFCIGGLTGILLLAAGYGLAGIDLYSIYRYEIGDNFGPGSTTDHGFLWRMQQMLNTFFYSELVLFYPFVLIYLFVKKKADWLVLWLVFQFIAMNVVGNYARVQLRDLLPAFSLMSAIAMAHIVETYRVPMKYPMTIIWLCFLPKPLEPFVNFKKLFVTEQVNTDAYSHPPFIQPDEYVWKKLGLWIKANTSVDTKVFIAGYSATPLLYSERLSPTIYFNATQTQLAKQTLYRDIALNKPGMILVPLFPEYKQYIDADLRNYIDRVVAKNYHLDRTLYSYNIYRLN